VVVAAVGGVVAAVGVEAVDIVAAIDSAMWWSTMKAI
jgi:hypothetical protein